MSYPEIHKIKFTRFFDKDLLSGDSYSGMPSILTMFPNNQPPESLQHLPVRAYATEKANGVAVIITAITKIETQ